MTGLIDIQLWLTHHPVNFGTFYFAIFEGTAYLTM